MTAAALLQSIRLLTGQTKGRRASVASYLIHLAGLFTHPTYVVVVLAFAGAAVLARHTIRSPIVTTSLAALATYVAVWGVVVLKTVALQTTSWMHTPGPADVQRAYMLIWGVGPGFMLVGALVAVTFRRFSNVLETLREAPTRWVLATVILAWTVPIIISLRQPIFEPTRTPMMLLPITAAAVAVILARLGGSGVALAFAGVCVVAAARRVTAEPGVDPYPTRDSLATLLPQMRCGDMLVAPGLAPWPVEYYFRRLDAPTCIAMVPFPKDPVNWAERMRTPDLLRPFEEEAPPGCSALSRGELHEASRIAESEFRRQMSCAAPAPLKGAFFDAVIRCDARKEP